MADNTNPGRAVERLAAIQQAIMRSARDFNRPPASITLVAVSKTMPAGIIAPVIEAGQTVFGENRVQEAKTKWPVLREAYPDLTLHLIGPLQTNKVRDALALFDVIETVDRPGLAVALAREMARMGRQPRLLVQVNTGEEPQKAGIMPRDADTFLAQCLALGLVIDGLMCIPPANEPPSPHFALLATIAARHGLSTLSMGMSADFEAAIQLGATHLRVGSAIFGERDQPVEPM